MAFFFSVRAKQHDFITSSASLPLPARRASQRWLWAAAPPSPLGIHRGPAQGCGAHRRSLVPQTPPSWERGEKGVGRSWIKHDLFLRWLCASLWVKHKAKAVGWQFLVSFQVDNSLFWVAAPEVVDRKDTFLFHRERQGLCLCLCLKGLLQYFWSGVTWGSY